MAPVNPLPGVESAGPFTRKHQRGRRTLRGPRGWRGTCMNFSGLGPGAPSLPGMALVEFVLPGSPCPASSSPRASGFLSELRF